MIGLLFTFAGFSSRTRSVWILPVLFFILILLSRAASMFTQNMYVLYFIYYSCFAASIILAMAFMAGSLSALFTHGHNLKSEVIFYKKLGFGLLHQFAIKIVVVAASTLFIWSLCSAIMWSFNYRMLILLGLLYMVLLLLRTAAVAFKTSIVYYVAAIILLLSFFYPVYILPNPAYLVKGSLTDVASYSSIYVLLYLTVGYKLFISSWRNECIGWMF